jgi:hypothetical protein
MPHRDSVWVRPWEVLSEHLDNIAVELDVYAEMVCSYTRSRASEEEPSPRPFFCQTRLNDLSVSVEFTRDQDTLRYASSIGCRRQVLEQGPAGVVDVHDGVAAASADIGQAFARITRFVDGRKELIQQGSTAPLAW